MLCKSGTFTLEGCLWPIPGITRKCAIKWLLVFIARIFLEVKYCSLITHNPLMRINWGKFSLHSISGTVTLFQGNMVDFHLVNPVNPVSNHISLSLATREFSAQFVTHLGQKTAQHAFNVHPYQEFHASSRHSLSPFTPISSLLKSCLILVFKCTIICSKLSWNQARYT